MGADAFMAAAVGEHHGAALCARRGAGDRGRIAAEFSDEIVACGAGVFDAWNWLAGTALHEYCRSIGRDRRVDHPPDTGRVGRGRRVVDAARAGHVAVAAVCDGSGVRGSVHAVGKRSGRW